MDSDPRLAADDARLARAEYLLDKAPNLTAAEYLETRAMLDFRLTVSVKEAMAMLGVGRTKLYELMESDEIQSFPDGKSRRILVVSIWRRLIRLAREGA
jgi:hypothetical protein